MSIATENQQLAKALAIVAYAFQDKCDKGGQPYFLHCLRVMNKMPKDDPELRQIAVMHDLPEDFPLDWPTKRIREEGFSERVCRALDLLNHNKEVPYFEYIHNLSVNNDCIQVKEADLEDNSDITRLKGITDKDMERIMKYNKSYHLIQEIKRLKAHY